MQPLRFYYLIKVQYLGYRLHGWQRQPNFKTVEGLIKKTLKYVLPERRIKVLGSSRTDAMVSANDAAFELFLYDTPLEDLNSFLELFNINLPPDIRAVSIKKVDASFNIIQQPKNKEYLYLFAFGEKSHPFCAPLMANFKEDLDIDAMIAGAQLYQGEHYFGNYCVDPGENSILVRTVNNCSLSPNDLYTASFFPEESYLFKVNGPGFLRYQIRLMMGTLVQLGKGEITLDQIRESLLPENNMVMNYIAPASGLILNKIDFE
ncbi:tRNA pseudouridine(38-40) synthase TruA [Antarcticibacterium arcticum]|uniref:tRNA pseudouridine synthase A n=1 Tax=Antarcticibacterium arcticum TaxID=2585771 RepID=A0A5B8YL26_9FLAO|nr:tRNA pseudouridine(38-40) synthase TruA [Antarcticibacterium arcticum]QED37026.1 tRNA pseudouridine(38-40) synthase TruA [Antarcticibacterium arcticum]